MATRVAVFIDYQNCYKGVRDAFFGGYSESHLDGQVQPRLLGLKLKNAAAGDRELTSVNVYRGMPSSRHDRKGHAATDRQVALWRNQVIVNAVTRPLNYRDPDNPKEKGIDVRIAIDMVAMRLNDEYDTAVLVSDDTDLLPPLELIAERYGTASIEVATWVPNAGNATPLRVQGHGHLIHRLTHDDYCHVMDHTDYTERRRRR